MGALDANGVYEYDGADLVPHAGLDGLLNLLGGSVSAVVAALDGRLDDVEAKTLPFKVAAGLASSVMGAGANFVNINIGFPAGRFTQAPIVLMVVRSTSGNYFVSSSVPSTALVTAIVRRYTGTAGAGGEPVDVYWVAVQMTSAAAAG